MRILKHFTTCISVFILFTATSFASDTPDVNEIITKANHTAFYQGNDGKAKARMLIIDSQGRKQFRQFTIARKDLSDTDSEQLFFVNFERPSDVKKTTFLVNKHMDKDDDRWLYLPNLDLVKRISAGDKRTSFVGSHFYYEDVSGRRIDEDVHELVETNANYYILKGTPKNPKTVEFSYYKAWIDKNTYMPVKTQYFDDNNKGYRKVEALKIEERDGFPTATKVRIDDYKSGGHTLMELRNVAYNVGLSVSDFSERSLRNPPGNLVKF